MKISVHSNIGKQRSSNQDYAEYFINETGQVLLVLCDGVGGSQAGDVASEMTTKFIGDRFLALDQVLETQDAHDWLNRSIEDVNKYIYDESNSNDQFQGMSTTLVMAIVSADSVIVAHVGDSRAYVLSEGQIIQITEDHSLVNELIRTGELTKEEGENHPRRNVVTQSIGGTPHVEWEINIFDRQPVDVLLLCSDGLSNMVSPDQMLALLNQEKPLEELGQDLVQAANDAGGTDNITLILVTADQAEEADGND